jgi:hypothetical protein
MKTRVGEITLDVPQVREGGFYPQALEKGLRSERALNLPQAWETPPRARPLTIRDFEAFCQRSGFRVASRTFLRGAHRMRTTVAANLRATTAIFELQ